MTLKKRRIILIVCFLIFVALAPIALLYSNGYRLDERLHIIKTGGLYISSPLSDSQIFINSKLEKETNILQKGFFIQNLRPGKYYIIVGKETYWPWAKELNVEEQKVAEARALLIPKEPKGEILKIENSTPLETSKHDEIINEIEKIKKQLATSTIMYKLSTNEKEKVWWSPNQNKLWVEWLSDLDSLPYYFKGEQKVLVLDSRFPIRSADFYPGRRDVLIISVQNGVFAIEIDGRGGRIIQPIYKGKEPVAETYKNESAVYLLDENTLIRIKLD
ncbi:MAG: hypothetical protein AB1643_00240 [Patescibacteria group bacterium]